MADVVVCLKKQMFHYQFQQAIIKTYKFCITTTAMPLANLSVKLMTPYINAPLLVLSPIKSAVIPKLVTKIIEPAEPTNQ